MQYCRRIRNINNYLSSNTIFHSLFINILMFASDFWLPTATLNQNIVLLSPLKIHHKSVYRWHWCLIAIHSSWTISNNSSFTFLRCWNMVHTSIWPFSNHQSKAWQLSYIALLRKMLVILWIDWAAWNQNSLAEKPFNWFRFITLSSPILF